MTAQDITNAIQTVGFPIVMVLLMGWYLNKKDKQHHEEVDSLRKALEANTSVLMKLETLMSSLIERRKDVYRHDTGRI